ncbi:MAG: hypothetical protein JRH08_16990, partial [Deltaproteobacteria bacterium]|nr:hypothetical protein [Deltaproteobacteria bacterium]
MKGLKETVVAACRMLRRVIISVTEDLYPLDKLLTEKAIGIDINCKGPITTGDFDKASKAFLGFVSGLRKKIEDDFRYINETFRVLLEQIKEL